MPVQAPAQAQVQVVQEQVVRERPEQAAPAQVVLVPVVPEQVERAGFEQPPLK